MSQITELGPVFLDNVQFDIARFADNRIADWVLAEDGTTKPGVHDVTPWSRRRIAEWERNPDSYQAHVEICNNTVLRWPGGLPIVNAADLLADNDER